jgi:hypothetical protein
VRAIRRVALLLVPVGIVAVAACDESTTGADKILDAVTDAGGDAPGFDAARPPVDASDDGPGRPTDPEVSACLACAVDSCREPLVECGDPCIEALECMERCTTVSCQDACLRDLDVGGVVLDLKICMADRCGELCPAQRSLLAGVTLLANAGCRRLLTCAPGIFGFIYASEADCREREIEKYLFQAFLPGSGGTGLRYADCADATEALSCDDFLSARADFACAIRGKRAVGEPCADHAQCESGYCPSANYDCGTCRNPPQIGQPCGTGNWCGKGERCQLGASGTTGTCVRPARAGEPCGATAPCESPYFCSGTCKLLASTAGAPCGSATASPFCNDQIGLVCSDATSGTCIRFESVGAGEACSVTADLARLCRRRTVCASGRCVAAPKEGEACNDTTGPYCTSPELCENGKCIGLPSPDACE